MLNPKKNRLLNPLLPLVAVLLFPLLLSQSALADTRSRGTMTSRSISAEEINLLGSWGANTARYPLEWQELASTSDSAAYSAWLETALTRFDEILPEFQASGIRVVLNLFTPPGGFQNDPSCTSLHRMFCESWAQEQFISTWQKIAQRYKGNTQIMGFDIVNEPAFRKSASGLKDWNQLVTDTILAIRAIDPDRTIIIEPPFGDIFRIDQLQIQKFSNLIYSPHFYYTLTFQHQGLYGQKLGISYPTKKFNKKTLEQKLERVKRFQKKAKAPIYIGEFSAVRWAPRKSAFNYLKDVVSIFEANKWHWTYHTFRGADAWSLEHDSNIKNKVPVKKETDRLKFMKKVFKKNSHP
jgi:endoglucanase